MPANDNVTVRIVGDASGVQPAVDLTGSSLQALEPMLAELTSQMAAMTAEMKEGFTAGATSAKSMTAGLEQTTAAAEHASTSIGKMSERIHVGGLSVGLFEKAFAPLVEIVAAAFAIDRVSEFINKMGEAAEQVVHLGQQFGMSVAQVQQLQGVAAATGISVDSLTRGMGVFDRNLATVATGSRTLKEAFDQVGVSIGDGRTQMEKLAVVADKFKNMDDGPKKAALAMQLFGRSGRDLIPVLDLGSAGIEQLNAKMTDYGVINEAAIASGEKLADNVNETKLGFLGVENVLMQALAPAFTEIVQGVNELIQAFVQSYQQGGLVAQIFEVIAATIRIAVAVVEDLGQIFAAVWTVISEVIGQIINAVTECFGISLPKNEKQGEAALNQFKDLLTIVKDAVLIFVDIVASSFEGVMQVVLTFAKVAWDALHLNWGAIESDWNAGMAKVADIVHEYANKIKQDAAEMGAAIAAAAQGKALGGGDSGLELPKAGGNFDYNPTEPGKKKKKEKDDLVEKLQEELDAKKDAWNEEQLAQDTAQQYSLQSEADFWAQALQMTDLSAKDRQKIEEKYIAAAQAVQKEEIVAKLETYKEDLAAAGQNWKAKEAILEQEQAYIVKMYGAQSKEARDAAKAVADAKKEEAKQVEQIQDEIYKNEQALRLLDIDQAEADAKFRVQMGQETEGQLLLQEKQFENQRNEIRKQALDKEKALIDPDRDRVQYEKISSQIEQLEKQHQNKLTQIDQQAVLQRTQIERNAMNQLAQGWAQNIAKLVTLQQGFTATLKGLYQTLQQAFASVIEAMLEKFIAAELMKIVYGKTTATATIAGEAAKAGAGGVASMAAAPWPLDMTAPAFGASMSAAALAFQSVNVAEGGDWNVDPGLYMLHKNEMVLPAWAANPLRDMISGASGAGPAFAPQSPSNDGAPIEVHFHSVMPPKPSDMQRFFQDHNPAVGAGVRQFVRNLGSTAKFGR